MNAKSKYLYTCLKKSLVGKGLICPSCGSANSTLLRRKYLVTQLRRCQNCYLQFRTPTTSVEENAAFYQTDYTQGFTTDMPSPEELDGMKLNNFQGSETDAQSYIQVLNALGGRPGQSLFDYGCSWGYGSWQFQQAGYKVTAFEISTPRAQYAKQHLEVEAYDDLDKVVGPFDIFFSAHVLEHVPSIQDSVIFARKVLKPGGLFVAATPNGSKEFKESMPDSWDKLWGLVHPNFLDAAFYQHQFANSTYLLTSSPYDFNQLKAWRRDQSLKLNLDGVELLVAAVF